MHWGYDYLGMHWLWWIVWIFFLIWIFFTPWSIPGERKKPDNPFDILQKRFAKGEINEEEYEKRKAVLQKDHSK